MSSTGLSKQPGPVGCMIWTAVTLTPQMGLKHHVATSHRPGGWKFKIKVPAGPRLGTDPLLGVRTAALLLFPHMEREREGGGRQREGWRGGGQGRSLEPTSTCLPVLLPRAGGLRGTGTGPRGGQG